MPNSRDLAKYPALLFDAFHRAASGPVTLQCTSPQAAKNLRSLMYTLRQLLLQSPTDWHQDLASTVSDRKFYINGSTVVIASPMHFVTHSATITPAEPPPC